MPTGRTQAADPVLLAAVGGPKWDAVPYEVRPEAGLLRLRKDMNLFANLRPAICYPALADASSLERELVIPASYASVERSSFYQARNRVS